MSARATRARAFGGWDLPAEARATLSGSHRAGSEPATHCLAPARRISGLPIGLAGHLLGSHLHPGGPSTGSGP
jgi:hypothetical protein